MISIENIEINFRTIKVNQLQIKFSVINLNINTMSDKYKSQSNVHNLSA